MRIRRIRLSNYRGIVEHEVFFPEGEDVTIVQGPNEVGKSCLTEAIDVLFDCRDDSRAMRVRSLQPVDRDVATEIELEGVTGEFEFTYSKRYHKERMTELAIRAPTPENLTGREAHDRAREILEQTLDVALWKALRIHQGMAVSQANVGQSTSLSAALDHAAGSSGGADADENESLFEAVTEEFLRYHTPTGRLKQELSERRAELERVVERVAALAERVRELDLDVARCARLGAELGRLATREVQVAEESGRFQEEIAALAGLREEVHASGLRWEGARGAAELARERLATRRAGLVRLGELEAELARVTADIAGQESAHTAAQAEVSSAEAGLRALVERETAARDKAVSARVDYEHWSDRDELEELGKRKERIRRAREEATDAQALLATLRVTNDAVRRIQESYNQLLVTRAVLQSKTSNLRLEVLRELTIVVGDERIVLDEGDVRQDAITAPLHLELPGLLRISIEPAEDLAQVRRKLDVARNEYMASCQAIGVDDLETALELLKQRQRAEAKIAERDRAVSLEFESWTDGLENRQETLRRRVFAYMRERAPGGPMPSDRETALEILRSAEALFETVRGEREKVSVGCEAIRARCGELGRKVADLAGRVHALAADASVARAALAEARKREADDGLEREIELSRLREAELRALHERTRADLESRGPDALRERVGVVAAALAKVRRELRETENERTSVAARVVLLGEEGLAEKYDGAESERLHLARELVQLESRARAAALLFHTLRARREEARRAYVRPLRERIEGLGRIVFGPDFQVEIDDDLRVKSRTLSGRTLSFESLSTGAREQIGIIARLACAMIVAADGTGVPMILDDALGYSDPERLREMGAVLTVAGRALQVIVLTSSPDRYLHVGGAQVLRLS